MLKQTPFHGKHVAAGGKMIPFAGFEMPIQFKGILHEVKRVRTTVGMFDVSHMGRVEISGSGALQFVSQITTNDPAKLETFQAQYSAMCYPDGGIVDDLLVYRLPDKSCLSADRFLFVINAANKEKDLRWMAENQSSNAKIEDVSDQMAQLAVQGPDAEPIMQPLVDINLKEIKYYWGAAVKFLGTPLLISRTGYTGEDGFELYFLSKHAEKVWDQIMDAGRRFEIEPVGLGSRDALRLEMGYCLYGNDIDKTTTPLEARLDWITRLDKGSFIGKEVLSKQKEEGVKRKLAAFVMAGKAIPRQHYKISKEQVLIGEVTSGNFSSSINRPIGMGYVKLPYNQIDTEIEIDCRGRLEKAKIAKLPFYKQATHK